MEVPLLLLYRNHIQQMTPNGWTWHPLSLHNSTNNLAMLLQVDNYLSTVKGAADIDCANNHMHNNYHICTQSFATPPLL